MNSLSLSSTLSEDLQYLSAALLIAKTPRTGFVEKNSITGSILVHAQQILAIGYDNPITKETAELMALAQIGFRAPGAALYTSSAPNRPAFEPWQWSQLVESRICRLIYGYCGPENTPTHRVSPGEQDILYHLEQVGIRLTYLRIPEILSFYAPKDLTGAKD